MTALVDIYLVRRHVPHLPLLWMFALTSSGNNHGRLIFVTGFTHMYKSNVMALNESEIIFKQLIATKASLTHVFDILASLPKNDNKSFVLSGLEQFRRNSHLSYNIWLGCMRMVTCPPSPIFPFAASLTTTDLAKAGLSVLDLWFLRRLLEHISAYNKTSKSDISAVGLSAGDGANSHTETDVSGAMVAIRWVAQTGSSASRSEQFPAGRMKARLFLANSFKAAFSGLDLSKLDLKPSTADLLALYNALAAVSAAPRSSAPSTPATGAGPSAHQPGKRPPGSPPSAPPSLTDTEFEQLMSQITAPEHSLVEQVLAADTLSISGMNSSSELPPLTDDEFQNFLSEIPLSTSLSTADLWAAGDVPWAAAPFSSAGPSSSVPAAARTSPPPPAIAGASAVRSSAAGRSSVGPSGPRSVKIAVSRQETRLEKSSPPKGSRHVSRAPFEKAASPVKTSSSRGIDLSNESEGKKTKHPSNPPPSRGAGSSRDRPSEKTMNPSKSSSSADTVPPHTPSAKQRSSPPARRDSPRPR